MKKVDYVPDSNKGAKMFLGRAIESRYQIQKPDKGDSEAMQIFTALMDILDLTGPL